MEGSKIDFALVNAERLRREPQTAILNEHRHLHGLAELGEVDCAELERIHTLVVDEMTRRGLEHSSPLECKAKAGLKLNEPHAYLVWKGKKKSIALPADDGKGLDGHLVGVPLVLCQNGAAGAEAYGEAILGNPAAMTPAQFDLPEYADCHCVRPEERREWWDEVKQFYVYPIKSFARYDKPRPVLLQSSCKCYLPDVRFKQYVPPTAKEQEILRQSERLPKQIILTPRAVSLTGSMLYGNHEPRDVDVVVVGAEWRPDEDQFVVPLSPTFKEKLERVLRAVYQTGNSVQYISEGEGPTFDHLPLYALALVRLPRLEVEHVSEMEPEMAEVGYDKDGAKYRPDQPRDEAGRFGSGGGVTSSPSGLTEGRKKLDNFENWHCEDSYETAMAVDPSGKELFTIVGQSDYVDVGEDNLAKTRGGIFSHIHPSGRSFSPEDIMVFSEFQQDEIRAAGTNKKTGQRVNYIMRPKEPGEYPRRDQVFGAWNVAQQEQKDIFFPKIWSNQMTVEDAEFEHGHEIWTKIAPRLGLEYRREIIG